MNSFLRRSDYTIIVPLEDDQKRSLFIQGYSGAIDIVDNDIAEYLKKNKDHICEADIPCDQQTLALLRQRNYITLKNTEEEREFVLKFANVLNKAEKMSKKYFSFLVTYNCNFRCPYCYESNISGNGESWTGKSFTKPLVDKAYNAMEQIDPGFRSGDRSILLYGGEPLLKENYEIVKYMIESGKKKGVKSFNAITNGYDLDFYKDLLGVQGGINFIQISLDGYREKHDQTRKHHAEESTFDKIIDNIQQALDLKVNVSVRINTNYNNHSDLIKLVALFEQKGFTKFKNFAFYSAPIYDYNNEDIKCKMSKGVDYLSRLHYNKIIDSQSMTANFSDDGVYNKIFKALRGQERLRLSTVYCGAVFSLYILDPYSNIYGCFETIGEDKYILGAYKF